MAELFRQEVQTFAAGRTDAGVHALGQVMGLPEAPENVDLLRIRNALNAMCAPSIAVTDCSEAPEGWHPRFSAKSRLYVYALLESEIPDPFLARTTHRRPGRLDLDAINEAAGHLTGEHDFSSFGRVAEPEVSAVRALYELQAVRGGGLVRIRARANSFIQQMVRSLVGTLVEVGEGQRSPDSLPGVLEARDRAAAGRVAPPQGLCLMAVEYDEGWSRPVDPLE